MEGCISAGVIAVIMGVDEVLDGQRRDFRDGSLDLVVQRCELAVYHDDAVGSNRDCNIAALTLEHIGILSKVSGL
jgi:hypothetical protein